MATGAAPSDDETLWLDPKLLLMIDCLEHSGQRGLCDDPPALPILKLPMNPQCLGGKDIQEPLVKPSVAEHSFSIGSIHTVCSRRSQRPRRL